MACLSTRAAISMSAIGFGGFAMFIMLLELPCRLVVLLAHRLAETVIRTIILT